MLEDLVSRSLATRRTRGADKTVEFTLGVRLEIRLSPADVGRRVSVRSLTDGAGAGAGAGRAAPGGPGAGSGARFTDTVGVLAGWADGELVIVRRDGEEVRLPESRLVAGKAVPAAPARRRGVPAAGTAELTAVAARGWPAPETAEAGGWLCRAAEGWTARANCAVPGAAALGPDAPPPDLERLTAWYAERGLPPRLQLVTGAEDGQELLAAELDRRGWRAERHAVLRVAPLAPLADAPADPRVRLHRELTEEWLRGYPNADRNPAAARRVLPAGPSVRFATVPDPDGGGRPAAVGRCVVEGRWAGFAAIEVAPEHRRRGLARAVMAELARAALAEGAGAAYLQVERGNTAARGLYDRLGFTDHHHYHYRRPPA